MLCGDLGDGVGAVELAVVGVLFQELVLTWELLLELDHAEETSRFLVFEPLFGVLVVSESGNAHRVALTGLREAIGLHLLVVDNV